jgi:hypothetical protein
MSTHLLAAALPGAMPSRLKAGSLASALRSSLMTWTSMAAMQLGPQT